MLILCDASGCGARHLATWWNDVTGKKLTFCGHHSDKYADVLVDTGRWQLWADERINDINDTTTGDRLTGAET